MIKSDIIFTGFYGQMNTGDDAFVEVASWGAKNFWNKINNRFLAKKNMLPNTIVPVKGFPLTMSKTYGLQAELLLNNTNTLIFAGGSTIHSKLKGDSIRMKAMNRKLIKGSPKIGAIGVSVGPFKSLEDESAVQSYLKGMDFLAVRDQASFDYVKSLDLPYKPINAFDLAALLPNIYNYKRDIKPIGHKKVIGISVCPYESVQKGLNINNEKKRNDMFLELFKEIDHLDEVHFRFYIINGNEKIGDRKLTFEMISKLALKSYEVVEYSRDTQSVWESIAGCDFIISTRLHAAIFACFADTPFMLNEYHRKCSDFLDNVDYNEDYRLYDSEYDIKDKALQIIEIINDCNKYKLPSATNDMKEKAKLNFTKIDL
ncbi:polysaccharide pyruvyl transferase family protein [Sphingobacterium multivorum]|uniref:Polysaccharide pyruvyl transferase family protein n=1 Tax=Sphingobacterium multivorum TaxID=28454 RepID=A0ABX7CMC1_SPHMU|nr:polysaccharide pyruvyl transferase family protein [Sphingobacterium multivorum]QQT53190.1 polysaccharide pyruvyl transferase family protein [Sphingobacterium multivorum]